MNKTIAIIIASVLVVSLGTATVALNNKNTKLESETQTKEITITELTEEVDIKSERINELEERVTFLEAEVEKYKAKVAQLQKEVKKQSSLANKYKGKINRRNRTIAELKKDIEKLSRDRVNNNEDKIAKLEQEKRELLEELKKYDQKYADALDDKARRKAELEAAAKAKLRAERIANIVQNTNVVFESVEARERKDSREMRKIKSKKWRYTNLQFHLQHVNGRQALLDENFAVIIRDLDTGKVLPYNEGNPKFPGKKVETGFNIRYNGNMFIVDYFNNEEKKGENFAAEVYYVLNGEHFPLISGTKKIISKGKVVKI